MKPIIASIAVLATLPAHAQLGMNALTPSEPAIACLDKPDLIQVITAGRVQRGEEPKVAINRLAKTMREKLDERLCFNVQPGQIVYSSPAMQNDRDFWSGIFTFTFPATGDTLYAYAPQWHGVW